jgi:hypothetical protein
MNKQIWLAALTAAFVAGGMAVAHAQAAGGGGGGGGAGGTDPSQRGAYTAPRSPIYKDERYNPLVVGHPPGSQW